MRGMRLPLFRRRGWGRVPPVRLPGRPSGTEGGLCSARVFPVRACQCVRGGLRGMGRPKRAGSVPQLLLCTSDDETAEERPLCFGCRLWRCHWKRPRWDKGADAPGDAGDCRAGSG